jgi:hypothetical protein
MLLETDLTFFNPKVSPILTFFFLIPFYLQSVLVHSANCVKTCIEWHVEECNMGQGFAGITSQRTP